MNTTLHRLLPTLAAALALSIGQASANYADSSNIRVDTRTLTMTTLVITGPSSIPWGQEAAYTATLNYQGAAAEDVTSQCEWSVTGGPPVTFWLDQVSMNGNVLSPKVVSTVPLLVSARITRNNGKIASNVIAVTVPEGNGLGVGIAMASGPSYVGPLGGGGYRWHFAAASYGEAVSQPGVTFQWFVDGIVVGTGATLDADVSGQPGTRQLRVVANDGSGRSGEDSWLLVLNQPAANERGKLIPVQHDPEGGKLLDSLGNPFQFATARIPNGIIVLTHGLRSSGNEDWLRAMANSMFVRLNALGKPIPNIVLLDWKELAAQSENYATINDDPGLVAGIKREVVASLPGLAQFIYDIERVKPNGKNVGVALSTWFRQEIANGNIDSNAPIHLIGHSAGGFVVGECALKLKTLASINVERITMLDTPLPYGRHHTQLPVPGAVERYISSVYGAIAPEIDGASIVGFGNAGLVSIVPIAPKPDTSHYFVRYVQNLVSFPWNWTKDHGYSHDWYTNTVDGNLESTGFALSPFITGTQAAPPAPAGESPSPAPADEPQGPQPAPAPPVGLDGFLTFGQVTGTGAPFVLTENGNCGIYLTLTLPVDADRVTFRYRFVNQGDGDYLVAEFGASPALFVASGDSVIAGEWLDAEISLAAYGGAAGDLVIKLMARQQPNAVVEIDQLQMVQDPDIDLDGILAAAEVAAGTDPRLADSDGDGIDDSTEMNTTHTNPVLADSDGDGANDGSELAAGTNPLDGSSRFAVKSSVKAGANFTITWSSVAGRRYRVLRSPAPDFSTYDVVGSEIAAAPPEQSFVDAGGAVADRAFYRVELEP